MHLREENNVRNSWLQRLAAEWAIAATPTACATFFQKSWRPLRGLSSSIESPLPFSASHPDANDTSESKPVLAFKSRLSLLQQLFLHKIQNDGSWQMILLHCEHL